MKGKLFVVATPIGNLADMTFRAIETLKSVAFVLAEDTRHTHLLLDHYSIKTQLVSYRDQNHLRMMPKILEKLDVGLDLALVSDAGTPCISDPGYKIVHELVEAGYEVLAVPGASACISAISISGMPTDRFVFLGFLPKSDKKRMELLQMYGDIDCSVIIYESPNRLIELLEIINNLFPERAVSVSNDLTKLHEATINGKPKVLLDFFKDKKILGEFVVVLGKEL